MEFHNLIIQSKDRITTLTINKPETLNALSSEVLSELKSAIAVIATEKPRVLIITGSGKAFVAGADITEMQHLSAAEGKAFGGLGAEVFRRIEELPFPVIAAINGFALGGGCELAMACDIRIASAKAKFGQPEVGLGITPGFSGTQRLPRLVAPGIAKELIYTGRIIDAEEALRIGLVNRVTTPEELLPATMETAQLIASRSASAVSASKEAINRGTEMHIAEGIALEQNLFGLCFATADQKEGMAAFLEKRKPAFC
ncbi:enoyl-CoA hydratase-related protein [Porphyromonas gingivalis]|uniref:Enoyl-CoA hydratase-related protein n=2 Tax=Porphyromonas gingivalis TaxID=837 RepID=A0AAE9X7U8_PORGN|nr:enoyl-CoA hydratase-related protein [Porphyromonas gingivalis]EOA11572.1 3-hydroxybutyryl-CoA dehydratase [Porphyromonas gingivalis JCVI SC001]ATR92649.1 enoyl-CoA hydratase [Porphyromonas gingivalis]ATR95352.1 enoyl-CoA hydratase [Porphyromonas gingivalis]ATR96613.1 enoyl-CoA hydratase [Porphyromonas gingivalis]ATS01262.1 enoyl-CoA hydratase [Porphyromonas gingivalis]